MPVAILSTHNGYIAAVDLVWRAVQWHSTEALTRASLEDKLALLGVDPVSAERAFELADRRGEAQPINIARIGDCYLAVAESKRLGVYWYTEAPASREELVARLSKLGFHPTDIYEAEERANDHWLAEGADQ